MSNFIISIITQSLTFIPLALGISISYHILRATDMTIDGSFVIGAAVFARLVSSGCPPVIAFVSALLCGALAGMLVAVIQRGGRVDALLAGVLATFILSSINLIIMGKPNTSLLSQTTLVSFAFEQSELAGWSLIAALTLIICGATMILMRSHFGLLMRAFGDNPLLLKRSGHNIERYRMLGFGLSNLLAASAGCITAQTVGYADIGMGFGVTLTGIGAIILGHQVLSRLNHNNIFRVGKEFLACLVGVVIYFSALNGLLRMDINPVYLKMILGILLITFLRAARTTS